MKTIVMIFMAASIAACNSGQNADSEADSNAGVRDTATALSSIDTATSDFLRNAAMVNKIEIEAGKLGQEQASNSEVKAFANILVEDHTNAMNHLEAIANKKRVEVPVSTSSTPTTASTTGSGTGSSAGNGTTDGNNPATITSTVDGITGSGSRPSGTILNTDKDQQSMLGRLRARTGADFNREFLQMMVNEHQKAIDLFEKASGISDPDIQAHANQMLPVLRRHEDKAKSLLKSLQ